MQLSQEGHIACANIAADICIRMLKIAVVHAGRGNASRAEKFKQLAKRHFDAYEFHKERSFKK